jgi:hypothetical protein
MEGGGGRGKEEVRNKMRGGDDGVAMAGESRRGGRGVLGEEMVRLPL